MCRYENICFRHPPHLIAEREIANVQSGPGAPLHSLALLFHHLSPSSFVREGPGASSQYQGHLYKFAECGRTADRGDIAALTDPASCLIVNGARAFICQSTGPFSAEYCILQTHRSLAIVQALGRRRKARGIKHVAYPTTHNGPVLAELVKEKPISTRAAVLHFPVDKLQ